MDAGKRFHVCSPRSAGACQVELDLLDLLLGAGPILLLVLRPLAHLVHLNLEVVQAVDEVDLEQAGEGEGGEEAADEGGSVEDPPAPPPGRRGQATL